tara:strand:+ start:11 stop:850 length:840 start_codon:yes stop_codon:yes gene_type:complete
MLKTRIIPVLLLKNGILVRSRNFKLHQSTGNHIHQLERLSRWKADEIIYLDISRDGRGSLLESYQNIGTSSSIKHSDSESDIKFNIINTIKEISKICFVPLTIGGKIKNLDDIRMRLEAGADKVSINTEAINNKEFISSAAKEFGSQCIVISIDCKKIKQGNHEIYKVFKSQGKIDSGLILEDWAKEVESLGAGEILIQSIDQDGIGLGYDQEMILKTVKSVNIPVIALGGVGEFSHFYDLYKSASPSALAAGNIFHFTEQSLLKLKEFLKKKNMNIRI